MSHSDSQSLVARLVRAFLHQPVYRLLAFSLVLVTALPLGFIGVQLYQQAWDNAWREINEKHHLLAANLSSPIKLYIEDHTNMLEMLAESIRNKPSGLESQQHGLNNILEYMKDFRTLALVSLDGDLLAIAVSDKNNQANLFAYADSEVFLKTRSTQEPAVSNINLSPVSTRPAITLSTPVFDQQGRLAAVLLGELRIDPIESLRRDIRFGEKGHSAVVDRLGHVIAHPNPDWMSSMYDMSNTVVVQQLMAGKSGVSEFRSPFHHEDMVVGFSTIPGIGWGILVAQPKKEIVAQVNQLLYAHLVWGVIGLLLAIALVIPLVIWITRPIKRIVDAANNMAARPDDFEIPDTSLNAPREIGQLCGSLKQLVSGLQDSHRTISTLNQSLQQRVDEATLQLRINNEQLTSLAQQDHLTTLYNRRHFESSMATILSETPNRILYRCLMLIDLDNFKQINDEYGHAAGDQVLLHLAELLKGQMRPGDLVARFGGDEFVAQMQCTPDVGRKRAQEILDAVRQAEINWQDRKIGISVSIGMVHWKHSGKDNMDDLLRQADKAMYEAKRTGRNRMAEVFDNPGAAA